jgi:hypothetical protein
VFNEMKRKEFAVSLLNRSRGRIARATSVAFAAALSFALGASAYAQGTQSGTLSGTVTSTDGASLPGVTVSVTSSALQGERSSVSDASGAYSFRNLPPGSYKVRFELAGFGTVEKTVAVSLGGIAVADSSMSVATVEETIEVLGEAPSMLTTTEVATNLKYAETVDRLAMNRNLAAIAELAPGLTDNGPNIGQVTIGGAFAYDNVFLLNGVDINDNLFGTANQLFIEDALQEVTVLTNGVSAEYGRFSGGVINAITKSGGNTFQGSWRTDVTNPDWIDESRTEKDAIAAGRGTPHIDQNVFSNTATLGGPVVKDRLWFFGAYRRENLSEARSLSVLGTGYTFEQLNRRYEGKLTGRIAANHNLQVNYIKNTNEQINNATINQTNSISESTLVTRQTPADLFVARYDGAIGSNLYAEAQFSKKTFGFRNTGGTSTDIFDSPFLALGRSGIPANSHYNAPYFDSTDPEDRNNKQFAGALSYFLSTGSAGRHDLKFGGEHFTSYRTGGNSQSSTGFVFLVDPVVSGGLPVVDSGGNVVPNFVPGVSQIQNWLPLRGARINLKTLSLYINDRWMLNDHWTFNLGGRMERHSTDSTQAGIASVSSSAFVPRLGATFDVKADGRWVLQATYGHYAGKASETQFADNTNVGTPSLLSGVYNGPAGTGVGFAPGFDVNNYTVVNGNFPIRNVFIEDDLNTPITKEWTMQAGTRLGNNGELKVIYSNRKTTNFLEDFITRDNGTTTVIEDGRNFGTFDNVVIRNTSDILNREYQALLFITNYRVTANWTAGAHWTHQLKNEGNFEGEAANQPGNYSIINDRPEIYSEARHFPTGRTDDYQGDKVRLYSVYDLKLGRAGTVSLGGVYRYDSPQAYSLIATNVPFSALQTARRTALGYARQPASQPQVFFGGRGIEEFEASHLLDFSMNYELPVYKTARPFFKAELRNAFNKQPLIGFNTTITPVANGPVDELGLPTTFTRGALFGTPVNNYTATAPHVPFPREFRFSFGVRF